MVLYIHIVLLLNFKNLWQGSSLGLMNVHISGVSLERVLCCHAPLMKHLTSFIETADPRNGRVLTCIFF